MNEKDERLLRASRLTMLADQLAEAIDEIRAFSVRIPDQSRLPQMLRLLRKTADIGSYPSDEHQLSVLAEAIRDSQEFVDIANVLPKDPFHSIQHDLRIAVTGKLQPVGSSTGPHLQYQTQLWIGSMLTQGGADVGMLMKPVGEKSPDFILRNGTLRYAVEVKRPNGVLDARNIIRKAGRQIRDSRFHGGLIVVDLTDCIDPSIRFRCGLGQPDFQQLHQTTGDLLRMLHNEVFDDGPEQLRARHEHVFGLTGFCRAGYWDLSDLSYPHLIRHVGRISYWRRDHRTLRAHRARWLSDLVHAGLSAAGHEGSERIPFEWSLPLRA